MPPRSWLDQAIMLASTVPSLVVMAIWPPTFCPSHGAIPAMIVRVLLGLGGALLLAWLALIAALLVARPNGDLLQQVGVFDRPLAPEVLDDGLFLDRVGEGDLEQAALAAVAVHPVQ